MGITASNNPTECSPVVLTRFIGEFASLSALETSHPTAPSGSYAIVNQSGNDVIYYFSTADNEWFTNSGGSVGTTPTLQQVHDEDNTISDTDYRQSIQSNMNVFNHLITNEQVSYGIDGINKNEASGFYNQSLVFDEITGNGVFKIPNETGTGATREYVDAEISSAVVGLLDDRGNHDASSNTFPSSGGSGTAGAILKGDLWTISVAGTLGGVAVTVGDVIRAKVDAPGTTSSNWVITGNNIGYVPENSINKATTMTGNTTSDTKFLTAKAVYDWVSSLGYWVSVNATNLVAGISKLYNAIGTETDGGITPNAVKEGLDAKQENAKLISANHTAVNNDNLIVNATCTITDVASPSNGTNYTATIVNGSVTIGGVVYGMGVIVKRIYNSGAWSTLVINRVILTNTSDTSTIVGFSSFNFKIIKEYDFGNGFVAVEYFLDGISNSPTTSFTLINNNISYQQKEVNVAVRNNGTTSNTNGSYVINLNSNVVNFYKNNIETAFTGSNQKVVRGKFIYYKG